MEGFMDDMDFLVMASSLLASGAIGMAIGRSKGVEISGFILGILLGPIRWIITSYLKGDRITCPYCEELILRKASICPYCQKEVQEKVKADSMKKDVWICPNCNTSNLYYKGKCENCKTKKPIILEETDAGFKKDGSEETIVKREKAEIKQPKEYCPNCVYAPNGIYCEKFDFNTKSYPEKFINKCAGHFYDGK
jgi:hypothetical protein